MKSFFRFALDCIAFTAAFWLAYPSYGFLGGGMAALAVVAYGCACYIQGAFR